MAITYNKSVFKWGSTIDSPYSESSQTEQGTYYLMNRNVEVQRTNNFEFATEDDTDNVIRLSVSRSSVPHYQQSTVTVKRGNTTIKFAGVPEFGDGEIQCVDYIGMETLKALRDWQSKSYNPKTEKVGFVTDYKKKCYLYEYTPDGQLVRTYTLEGCWISRITEDQFDHESNSVHRIQVTIVYDKAFESDPDVTSSLTVAPDEQSGWQG